MHVGDTNVIPGTCEDGMTTVLLVMGRGKDRVEKLDTSYGDAARTEYWRYTLVDMDGIRRDEPARAALHCIYTGNM
jgi:hypothetical protein